MRVRRRRGGSVRTFTRRRAATPADARSVLFFRQYGRFQGGHLKVWDYFQHTDDSGDHVAYVRFTPDSVFDASNPWVRSDIVDVDERSHPVVPDVLFVAGTDWLQLPEDARARSTVPLINLVQHVRHGNPGEQLYEFLTNKAIRICVDPAVEEAILATGRVNGPTFTIQNGTDLEPIADPDAPRDIDLEIAGFKQPATAERLAGRLDDRPWTIEVLTSMRPRAEVIQRFSRAKVTLLLPDREEGAYLPPMEGMAMGTIVVCPDHAGTSYCRDGVNALRPSYDDESVLSAVETAMSMAQAQRAEMIDAGFETVRTLTLASEEKSFWKILRRVDELWRDEN